MIFTKGVDHAVAEVILIAGPNGAGKTTFARQVLRLEFPNMQFLNLDEIQRENAAHSHPIAAGREMMRRMAGLERYGRPFAVETTLSSIMYASKLEYWGSLGYQTILHFIELPSADFAVRRVVARVAAGGHSVPEVDIRRRFERGKRLFEKIYKPLPDEWYHWFSDDRGLRLVNEHP
jgi:predicted ABC-type ATPase